MAQAAVRLAGLGENQRSGLGCLAHRASLARDGPLRRPVRAWGWRTLVLVWVRGVWAGSGCAGLVGGGIRRVSSVGGWGGGPSRLSPAATSEMARSGAGLRWARFTRNVTMILFVSWGYSQLCMNCFPCEGWISVHLQINSAGPSCRASWPLVGRDVHRFPSGRAAPPVGAISCSWWACGALRTGLIEMAGGLCQVRAPAGADRLKSMLRCDHRVWSAGCSPV
jgi:hypothetical protein